MTGRWWIMQPIGWLVRSNRKQEDKGTGNSGEDRKCWVNVKVMTS